MEKNEQTERRLLRLIGKTCMYVHRRACGSVRVEVPVTGSPLSCLTLTMEDNLSVHLIC